MRLKSFLSTFVTTGSFLLMFGLGAVNASAQGALTGTCSNATLTGRYAHLVQGAYGSATAGAAAPFQGIQTLVFDGNGTITGSESFVAGAYEITNPTQGVHFVPVVGTYTINSDCTGLGYICSNHATGLLSGTPSSCNLASINSNYGSSSFWSDFVAVTIVVTTNGNTFHMLVIPPYDGGTNAGNGVVRTISSTGTRMGNTN